MSSNIVIPASDFASLLARLEEVERKIQSRLADGIYHYGPCLRCGYGPWDSVSPSEPRCCPRCHSAYWDRPPRKASARRPEDPPLKRWATKPRKARMATPEPAPVVEPVVPVAAIRHSIVLPPELRPPGEPLIPPPPRILTDPIPVAPSRPSDLTAMSTLASETEPTAHVAALPDAVVEAVLAGESVGYEEIKAAREGADDAGRTQVGDTTDSEVLLRGVGEQGASGVHGDGSRVPENHAVDPSLQAKKDAFFADAIDAGLVSSEPEGTPAAPETPFVTDAEPPSLAPKPDDDPFWK